MKNSDGAQKSGGLGLIPSIEELLGTEAAIAMIPAIGRRRVLSMAREAAESIRHDIRQSVGTQFNDPQTLTREFLLSEAVRRLDEACRNERTSGLRRVINATGVVIHTNLGRAPLSESAKRAVFDAAGYSTIEFDVLSGKRGPRCANAERLIADLTGAEAAVIVNNCAAAALLVLSTLASGGEVLVSRGELVEIGGDFRIPDVLKQSGAALREVGTTNRTNLSDYENAISDRSAMILRVHPSNYRIIGFTEKPTVDDLAALARQNGIVFYEDAGSGALIDLHHLGLTDEPVIGKSILAGADIVSFSADKLLGGPQAGLIVGRRDLVERLRKHPLYRALRVGKLVCAALEATLEAYARDAAVDELPVLKMLSMSAETIMERAERFKANLGESMDSASGLTVGIVPGNSAVGGGAAPDASPETALIALTHSNFADHELEEALRLSNPPVITRIAEGKVLIDLRTVSEGEETDLIEALEKIG